MLYEVLTGSLPIDHTSLLEVGLEEMRRALREASPPRPSARLTSVGDGAVVEARRTDLRRLRRFVRGELDWIVMKAIDRDPERRYASSAELGADLDRLLRHEPVHAAPPTAAYRIGKFVRRHRAGVAAGAIATIALLVGLGAAILGFVQARAERDAAVIARESERLAREVAEREGERSQVQGDFISWGLGIGNGLPIGDEDRSSPTLLRMLDIAAQAIDTQYANDPLRQAVAHSRLGSLYTRLVRTEQADRELTRAIETLSSIDTPAARTLLYESLRDLDSSSFDQGASNLRILEARRERILFALDILKRRFAERHPQAFVTLEAAVQRLLLPSLLSGDEARALEAQILSVIDAVPWECDHDFAMLADLVVSSVQVADGQRPTGVLVTMSIHVWDAIMQRCPELGAECIRAAIDEVVIGLYCIDWDDGEAGRRFAVHGEGMVRRHLPPDHPILLVTELYCGEVQVWHGDVDRGFAMIASAIDGFAALGTRPLYLGYAVSVLLKSSRAKGRPANLERFALPLAPFAAEIEALSTAATLKAVKETCRRLHERLAKSARADPTLAELTMQALWPRLESYTESYGAEVPEVTALLELFAETAPPSGDGSLRDAVPACVLWRLGDAALSRGEFDRALDLFARSKEIRVRMLGPDSPLTLSADRGQGKALFARGERSAGLALLEESYERMHANAVPSLPALHLTARDLGLALARDGKAGEAGLLFARQTNDTLDYLTRERHGLRSFSRDEWLTLAYPIVLLDGLTPECYAAAERCASLVIEQAPRYIRAHAVLGASLLRRGRSSEAEPHLLRAEELCVELKATPAAPTALFLARCARERGDAAEFERLRTLADQRAAKVTPDLASIVTWEAFRVALLGPSNEP